MNYLFVCSRNKWRSRTAEEMFKNNGQHPVKSAGTAASARIKINQKLIDWADIIFVMETRHKKIILQQFSVQDQQPIIILDIPDDYQFMDEELIDILEVTLSDYF